VSTNPAHDPRKVRSLGGDEAQGGYRRGYLAKPQASARDSRGVGVLGGAAFAVMAKEKPWKGAALERAYGTWRGVKPRRVNPRSGTGMK
jgi:hypothetical protein